MKEERKKKRRYLKIYAPVIPEDSLDPTLFNYERSEPRLRENIFRFLIQDIKKIQDILSTKVAITKAYVTGPALGSQHRKNNSKVVVVLIIDGNSLKNDFSGLTEEKILQACRLLSNKLIPGTLHPVFYKPQTKNIDRTAYNGIYNLQTHQWVQKPILP